MVDNGTQYGVLGIAFNPVKDAAGLEGLHQRRHGDVRALGLAKDIRGYGHVAPGRPFQEFGAIQTILFIHPVSRDNLFVDPAVDGFF